MNSKEFIITKIKEVTGIYPEDFDNIIHLQRVTEKRIDEFVARYLVTYAPIYLPIFERDGDLFSLHVTPKTNSFDMPVLKLFHDVEIPRYFTTNIKTFCYALFDCMINFKHYYDEILLFTKDILLKNKLSIPEKEYFEKAKNDSFRIIIDFDKNNKIMQIREKTSMLFKKAAFPIIEEMYNQDQNKLYFICHCLIRSRLQIDFDKNKLLDCMYDEYSYSFNDVGWYDRLDEGIRMMEAIKQICLSLISPDNPFYKIKEIPLNDPMVIDKLLEIASIFAKKGDDITALNQVRNACTIAGAYGNGLTKELCKTLAEYTKKVEPDGLAYHLANFAVDVIDLGP
jgi:hypothetical protein